MAAFSFINGNPQELEIIEASTFQLPDGVHEFTIRVVSGTLNVNAKSATMTLSPDYTSANGPIVIKDSGLIYLDSADDAVIIIEI